MTARRPDPTPGLEPERGLVLAVLGQGVDPDDELAELEELARTAGVEPVERLVQHRPQPDTRSYVGKGKLDELKQAYGDAAAEVLLVDDELSPSQQRLLENQLQARVVDRTQLILDIFAQHAISAEGKLQVELAQLEYNLPRMRGMWQHLERLGGGVGTRGPGESQLETDRRIARRRVSILKGRLRELAAPARHSPEGAAPQRDADGRARRLHERRQVDAAQRAHRRRRLRPQPAVRDARPDDARLRARGPPLPRDRHGRLHPPAPASARRRLRGDARGDARRRPRAPRRRRLRAGGAARRDDRRRERRPPRDRRGRPADRARHEQDRPRRPAPPPPARQPLPRRAAGLRASPAKGSTSCAHGSPSASPSGSSRCGCSSRTTRAAS